ncbi:glycosyltransferase [Streptococcus milleri]|uniref:Glycosyltransferase n=1 Tax=Streptococcus milleri TaxID=33040 RepID=A0A380L3G1_9STRE|nr:glycosyltransferase family 4 protein [Streptococcus milleri]SUN80462.1 glycosyltransferase [Streptococcus milleri]
MKKTILFISPTGTLDNGAEISIVHLMEYLVQTGHTVINAIPDYHVSVQQDYMAKLAKKGIETLALPSVKWWWEDAPGGLAGTHNERVISYQENIAALRKIIIDKQIELVITNTVNMFQGAVAAACENIPHFWLIHEFPNGEFGYYREKIDFIDHFSDEIFAVTGALRAHIEELLPDRRIGEFVPYSHIDKLSLKHSDSLRIVQIGRVTDNKNQLELIKAYRNLDREDIPLVFIGTEEESYSQKCRNYIQKYNLHNIEFLGYRDNPWLEVTDKDLCVFTSKIETFGMVYVESLLHGVPAVVSDNKGYQSVKKIFLHGLMYKSGDIVDLSDTIKTSLEFFYQEKDRLMKDRKRMRKLYSLDNVYKDILNHIAKDSIMEKKEIELYTQFLKTRISISEFIKKSIKLLFT